MALFVAMVYSEQLGGLTVAFGVARVGIASAAQEITLMPPSAVAVNLDRPLS